MWFQDDSGRYWNINLILNWSIVDNARPMVRVEFLNSIILHIKDTNATYFLSKINKDNQE